MPMNGYNVGRDVVINFQTATGPRTFPILTEFESRQMTKRQESHALDGTVRFQYIPGGWEGHFVLDRASRNADDIIFEQEQAYYAGQAIEANSITETITEVGGGISQWRYEGVMIAMPEHGNAKGDTKLSQRIDFCASFRKKVQ